MCIFAVRMSQRKNTLAERFLSFFCFLTGGKFINESDMKKKIVTFGEIMLRLTTPDNLRLQQSRELLVNYGGSEANVAISIANFGGEVEYITRLPDNALGESCIAELRSHNIGTGHILIGGKRLGTYYMEKAAAMRNSKVIYDRDGSAFSELKPGMVNWREIFKDAAIFHWSGIDAALTPGLAEVCREAVDIAKEMGLTISYDINYRKNLWNYGKTAQEVLRPLMTSSDIMFGSEGEYAMLTGIPAPGFKARNAGDKYDVAAYEAFCQAMSRQVPDCKYIYVALRNVMSSEHHTFAGLLYSNGTLKHTRVFDIDNVVDCVGVGDAFCGALLYAQHAYDDDQKRVDFSTAASVLKNTIAGDYNIVKVSEVEGLLAKDENGEVAR